MRRSTLFMLVVTALATGAAPVGAKIQRVQSSPDRVIRYCNPSGAQPAQRGGQPPKCAPIATGDFNGDGRDDAVFLSLTPTMRNNGSASFQRLIDIHAGPFSLAGEAERSPMATLTLSDGTTIPSIAVGDFDGDGIDDLIMAEAERKNGVESQRVVVKKGGSDMTDWLANATRGGTYRLNRTVTLAQGTLDQVFGQFPLASVLRPRLADIDGDGRNDLLLSVDPAVPDIKQAVGSLGGRVPSDINPSKEVPSYLLAFLDTPSLAKNSEPWNLSEGDESLRIDGLGSCEVPSLLGTGDVTGDGLTDMVLRRCPGAGVPDMLGLVTGRREWPAQLTIDGAVKARPNVLPPGPAPTAAPVVEPPRGYVAFQPIPKSLFDQPSAFFIQDINLDGVDDVGFGFSDKTHIWLGGPGIAARIKASHSDRVFLQAGFGGTNLSGTWRLSDLNGDKQVDLLLTQRTEASKGAAAVEPVPPPGVLGHGLGRGTDGDAVNGGGSANAPLTEPIKIYVGARADQDMLNLVEDSPDAIWQDPAQDLWLIGDFNGDGLDDVMVGSPGSSGLSSYQVFEGPFIR